LLFAYSLQREHVYRAVAYQLLWHISTSSHCIATAHTRYIRISLN
jgi:hypothetical protein